MNCNYVYIELSNCKMEIRSSWGMKCNPWETKEPLSQC